MEPWLDSLSEDWSSDRRVSSPAPSISSQQKRSSIGSVNSQSRIPHLAQNIRQGSSNYLRPRSTRGLAKAGIEPVLVERSASSLNVPRRTSGSQKRLSVSTIPRRASSAFTESLNSVQHHTVHERPDNTDTPEWKRRLIGGDDLGSDGLNLFSPSKLEGIFKEPVVTLDKEKAHSHRESVSRPWKTLDTPSDLSLQDQYQSLRASRSRRSGMAAVEEVDEDAVDDNDFSAISSDVVRHGSIRGLVGKRVQSLERVVRPERRESIPGDNKPTSASANSMNDTRWRTVSGRKELEDEFISPVTTSRQHTIRDNAVKDSLEMDLHTLDQKLAQIGIADHHRPSSSSSDRQISYGYPPRINSNPDNDPGDITSHSLPDDLSMGTQDFISQGGYINRRRGGASNEASFLRRGLSSATSVQGLPSSPPQYALSDDASLPQHSIHDDSVVHHEESAMLVSSGSPLKLFGNRDTYTNNKLMRMLSHFDESSHLDDRLPNDVAKGGEQSELRLSRFGEGQLVDYNFDFEKQISPADTHAPPERATRIFTNTTDQIPDNTRPIATSDVAATGGLPLTPLRSPKRRRTLLQDEVPADDQQLEAKVGQVHDLNRLAGTKRKDAKPGDAGLQADLDVLATRTLLHPRAGRKSSNSHSQSGADLPLAASGESLNNQAMTQALAAELASFAHEATEMRNDSRKPSLATKDYMEEANKVMEFIRARGKPKLPSIDEPAEISDLDPDKILDLDIDNESTKEEFSRPPSREGPVRTPADRRYAVHDAETASYLRKYRDDDDLELLANMSGLGTLRAVDNRAAEEASQIPVPQEYDSEEQESSPPNVRILNPYHSERKRKHSASTVEGQHEGVLPRVTQTGSSGDSTQRTFPTTSSTGNKGMITSGTVSIPDRVGTMTFDHERKIWVQSESKKMALQPAPEAVLPTNDEDPFVNIPDLSFEAHLDGDPLRNIHHGSFRRPYESKEAENLPISAAQIPDQQGPEEQGYTNSSLRSEISRHEARLHDGVPSEVPNSVSPGRKQARAVTIAFSSPLISAVRYPDEPYISDDDLLDEEVDLPLDDSEESLIRSHRKPKAHATTHESSPVGRGGPERYDQYRAMTLNRRPVSTIDEREEEEPDVEMSLVHVRPSQELTPAPPQSAMVKIGSKKNHNTSILCLTPLSEFSLHQIDRAKHPEDSFVETRVNPKALRQAHGSQSLSVDALVKAITDAASGELYWDLLRSLRLDGKRLTTLHGLEEYCPGLEEFSAADNEIVHLNGIPSSLRVLDLHGNSLTSLASWGALSNLQYVDVSNNQLENLDGFGCLIHLRRLVANNNSITSIEGVMELDGLLELEIRGNALVDVDFDACELVRLRRLDMGNNKLKMALNLHQLTKLEDLDMCGNHFSSFADTRWPTGTLRALRLANNDIETFDLSVCSGVQVLELDGNKIKSVSGLETAYSLEQLSLRGQRAVSALVSDVLSSSSECRKINLSSNVVPGGIVGLPSLPQWNVRELELSGCGISGLPLGFGDHFPNCRLLNLNFNGISDLGNLRGMYKVSELQVARNRIKRMRRTCLILSRLCTLRKLDMRDNPLTVGFYAPQGATSVSPTNLAEEHYNLLRRCPEQNRSWLGLLDETTRLKRRTIELLLVGSCPKLEDLDGGHFKTDAAENTDQTWDALTRTGVLVMPTSNPGHEMETNELEGADLNTSVEDCRCAEGR